MGRPANELPRDGPGPGAGKRGSGRTRRGSRWLRRGFCQTAWAATRKKGSYFKAQSGRIAQTPPSRARTASRNSNATAAVHQNMSDASASQLPVSTVVALASSALAQVG
jgi:hypothetical protein